MPTLEDLNICKYVKVTWDVAKLNDNLEKNYQQWTRPGALHAPSLLPNFNATEILVKRLQNDIFQKCLKIRLQSTCPYHKIICFPLSSLNLRRFISRGLSSYWCHFLTSSISYLYFLFHLTVCERTSILSPHWRKQFLKSFSI